VTKAFYLLGVLAMLGAADTVYYHEFRARLPALGKAAAAELRLHAFRDFVYAILFACIPWLAWYGWWSVGLGFLLLVEAVLTLWDFVVEDWVRKPLGGLYAGERIMHAVMGIVYGAMLAYLVPSVHVWWSQPSDLLFSPVAVPSALRWMMVAMAAGVFFSGLRDLCAASEVQGSAWPWRR
jgi:hypothetical protein